MPMIDMPLEELRSYRGCTPAPEDFDEYWRRAREELDAVTPRVSIVPSGFQSPVADCFDLTFTGVRDARIYAKLLKPKQISRKCPAVLTFHGYKVNSGDWVDKIPYAASGFVVACMDCRGQGGRSQDVGGVEGMTIEGHFIRGLDGPPDDMLMRHIFLDTAELARIVMEMPDVDRSKVGVFGGSQGGGLSLACASLVPEISRCAVYYPFLSDYKRVWELDLTDLAYSELRRYFRFFDPLHERETEIYQKLGYVDVQNLVKWIRGRVLMTTGLMDTACPPSTQFAAYNKIAAEKEMVVYPDYGHEVLHGNQDRIYRFLLEMAEN